MAQKGELERFGFRFENELLALSHNAPHQEWFIKHLLETTHDRVSRLISNAHRQFDLIAQVFINASKERAATCENDSSIVNVTCDFGR